MPQTEKKNTPKQGRTFSIFSHVFGDKKNIFLSPQVTKLCSENFEKWKKSYLFFWVFFFSVGGGA